jgi:hypothetical protein
MVFSVIVATTVLTTAAISIPPVRRAIHPLVVRVRGERTDEQRVAQFADARLRLRARFARADMSFPPARVVLLGLKDERKLIVYATQRDGAIRRVVEFPIVAASGSIGPKLREGDRQVPEGVYALESLNPNSRFHAALRVGYPNEFDRAMAARDGRTNLGGDIMIHGSDVSIGCLAMGDPAIEELFVLAAAVGVENVKIILAPCDLRKRTVTTDVNTEWRAELYKTITDAMRELP